VTRARAIVTAVPQRVWTAVAGLALLASIAVAAVIGAGLQVWRSAVGSAAQPLPAAVEPPSSGLVVLPGSPQSRPHVPVRQAPPSTPSGGAGAVAGPSSVPPAAVPASPPVEPVAFVPSAEVGGEVPSLILRHRGVEQQIPAPLTARLETAGASEGALHANAAALSAHARHQAHENAEHRGRHHARHAARAQHGHHAAHRHGGRHR